MWVRVAPLFWRVLAVSFLASFINWLSSSPIFSSSSASSPFLAWASVYRTESESHQIDTITNTKQIRFRHTPALSATAPSPAALYVSVIPFDRFVHLPLPHLRQDPFHRTQSYHLVRTESLNESSWLTRLSFSHTSWTHRCFSSGNDELVPVRQNADLHQRGNAPDRAAVFACHHPRSASCRENIMSLMFLVKEQDVWTRRRAVITSKNNQG